jgi:hypothetical protein
MVRAALREYVVEGVEAPPNFSVIIGEEQTEGDLAAGLHFLHRNHTTIVRTRRPERVMEALFRYLAGYLPSTESDGLIRVTGVGLVKEGMAVLAPRTITTWTAKLAPRLNRSGVQYIDAPLVTVDVDRGEVVVEDPDLFIDRTALESLGRRGSGKEPDSVKPGRYPLVGWAIFAGNEDQIGPISAAQGVVAAAPGLMRTTDLNAEEIMEALGRVFVRTTPVAVGSPTQGDLSSKLLAAFPH